MNIREFNRIFKAKALSNGWVDVAGGWLYPRKDRDQCTVAIEVQKSSYGKQFYIGINVYIDGAFGLAFKAGATIQDQSATLYRRQPREMEAVFDLTSSLGENERSEGLSEFFEFLGKFAEIARTRHGVLQLADSGLLFIAPGVRAEIDRISNSIE